MHPTSRPRRDMSYRKPAPKYIPSPPPSPPPSSPVSFNRLSFSLGSAMSNDIPPLPADWREIMDRALYKDNWTHRSNTVTGRSAYLENRHTSYTCDIYRREQVSSVLDVPSQAIPSSTSQSNRRHMSSQSYRPPTPPTAAHYKRRRSPGSDSPIRFSVPVQLVYPDLPSSSGLPDIRRHSPLFPSLPLALVPEVIHPTADASVDTEEAPCASMRPSSWRLSTADGQAYSSVDLEVILPVHHITSKHMGILSADLVEVNHPGLLNRVRRLWICLEAWRKLCATKLRTVKTVLHVSH